MVRSLVIAAIVLLPGTAVALAQYPASPVPLIPPVAPPSFEPETPRLPERGMPGSQGLVRGAETAPGSEGSLTPPPRPM